MPTIFKRAIAADDGDHSEFILSDETRDRYGDIIRADGWKLAAFKKNPVALYGHDASALPIGRWANVRIEGKQLRGRLELAEPGTSGMVDAIRSLIKQKILRAVSVGLIPLESEPIDENDPWSGLDIKSAELVECSVVPVPANPSALAVKSLSAVDPRIRKALAATGTAPADYDRTAILAALGKTQVMPKANTMTLREKINAARTKINALRDQITPLAARLADEEGLQGEELTTYDQLTRDLDDETATLRRLEAGANALGQSADDDDRRLRTSGGALVRVPTLHNGGPIVIDRRSLDTLYAQAKRPDEKKKDLLPKILAAHVLAFRKRMPLDQAFVAGYPDRADLHQLGRGMMFLERAATAPAMTTVTGWAAELVQQGYGEFLSELTAVSVYGKITSMIGAYRFSFGTKGKITVPRRNVVPLGQTGDLSGAFVGEGKPIPVRRGILGSVTLTPKKMGVISEFTDEMMDFSVPDIEQIIRNGIVIDTARTVDMVLLDAGAETAIRPAGLGNGLTPIAGAVGADEAALRADIKAALAPFAAANAVDGLVWLMNPMTKIALTLMTNALGMPSMFAAQIAQGNLSGIPFIESTNVALHTLWLVRYYDLASASGDTPEFSVSDQATLHEVEGYAADGTASGEVLPISTGAPGAAVVATPIRSLWQTESFAVRMILPLDWGTMRPNTAQKVTGITWD
jgi:HK97 family phage prohead protease